MFGYVGSNGAINNLSVDGQITSIGSAGGIVVFNMGILQGCHNKANITAYYAGGIATLNAGTITGCCNSGTIHNEQETEEDTNDDDSLESMAGGIAGGSMGIITHCYNTASITGYDIAGGIVSVHTSEVNATLIDQCYNTGTVTGKQGAGGIAGLILALEDSSIIQQCYNTGAISSADYAGGITSLCLGGTLKHCYNYSTVASDSHTQGSITSMNYFGTITNCYYNRDLYSIDLTSGVSALTTTKFATQANFAGWNFNTVWTMSTTLGRPILQMPNEENPATALPMVTQSNYAWSVTGAERALHISGTDAEATVYSITGHLVYRGTARTINLPAVGIYVVRIGNEAQRAIVR